ncbi:hypothetical protein [Methylocystis sp.]|uniref:hypothetical protein n=1 Tax=Methylocystis sp. TaxID=1911079 RepID=UPI0027345EE1|nr:hypothetical protein [Methylocystis sp.]MDP3552634.1 hypothetical protein [Methylocystis sp.]
MNAEKYLEEICRPNFKEFSDDPTSLRRAWSATAALYHFVDYLADQHGMNVSLVKKKIMVVFPRLGALRDVTNAFKHCEVELGSSSRLGLRAEHSLIGKGAAFSDGTYFSDGTSFAEVPEVIRVEFNGEFIDLLWLCREVLDLWDKHVSGEQVLLS